MNNYPLLQYLSITSKHLLWQFGNSGTFGIPEALKNSANEIYLQSKLANEGLYYLQVKTFLETLELDENDIEKFMAKTPNHQRLGFEIFKILENTMLEDQAKMLAKVFQLLAQEQISKHEFDKYTYIITKLNNYLITLIENLYTEFSVNSSEKIISMPLPNMDLISFGFVKKLSDGSWFAEAQNSSHDDYEVHDDFIYFYENIFKD